MIERHGVRNRWGIYEKALPPGTPSVVAAHAARAGYDFIELAIDESFERLARLDWTADERAEVRRAVKEAGASIDTLTLSAHRRYPWGSADPAVRSRAAALARDTIDLTADLGAGCVQIAGYFTFYEPTTRPARGWFLDGLAAAADYAAARNVILALENMDGTDVLSVDDALSVIAEVPAVRLYVDVGNLAGNQLPVLEQLATALPYAHAIQLKDARPGEFRRVPFGKGSVPFVDILTFLQNVGYTGPLSVEMWNDDGSPTLATDAAHWFRRIIDSETRPAEPDTGCTCGPAHL
ncbi:L-ribulose-5-phosphate 3-epimerase [Arthrobacter methylotrophus]|uniref:L-ribulose-5-phosphate 3-epimerase n=1 Tax=Arthrobacter methylotrophus TaxID=121291 RepID=A0ABV5USS6_9MICC